MILLLIAMAVIKTRDKVHLRQEIEACRPPGEIRQRRKRDSDWGKDLPFEIRAHHFPCMNSMRSSSAAMNFWTASAGIRCGSARRPAGQALIFAAASFMTCSPNTCSPDQWAEA